MLAQVGSKNTIKPKDNQMFEQAIFLNCVGKAFYKETKWKYS